MSVKYAVIFEHAPNNWAAYVPDLPDCIATGTSLEETEANIHAVIEFHLDGMREDGTPPPQPSSHVEYIEVAA